MFDQELMRIIYEWQDLIGAAIGPFLAIILSGFVVLIKSWTDGARVHQETLRRVEIDTARALNDIFFVREKLKYFVNRLRELATDIRAVANPKEFNISTINCPVFGAIYSDSELPHLRLRSYYLHNRTMWMAAETAEVNGILMGLQKDFSSLIQRNDMLVGLMSGNDTKDATSQRIAYAENLELFANGIEDWYTKKIPKTIKSITQLKIYNGKIRETFWRGFLKWWIYEGLSFKYFKDSKTYKTFSKNLESLDRIDRLIEQEVFEAIEKAEQRGRESWQKHPEAT